MWTLKFPKFPSERFRKLRLFTPDDDRLIAGGLKSKIGTAAI